MGLKLPLMLLYKDCCDQRVLLLFELYELLDGFKLLGRQSLIVQHTNSCVENVLPPALFEATDPVRYSLEYLDESLEVWDLGMLEHIAKQGA